MKKIDYKRKLIIHKIAGNILISPLCILILSSIMIYKGSSAHYALIASSVTVVFIACFCIGYDLLKFVK
jgi:hypothetical protein